MTDQSSLDISSKLSTYPRIIIQPDWSTHLKSRSLPVDVWIEYKAGSSNISRVSQNIHGVCSIKAAGDQDAKVFKTSPSEKFQSNDIDADQQQLKLRMQDSDFAYTFQGPSTSFSTTSRHENEEAQAEHDPMIHVPELESVRNQSHSPSVHPHCFDISSGGIGLTALSNGTVNIWDINNGQIRRKLKGHAEDVYIARFFPSDFAAVSGGADMRVKIWSLDSENKAIHDVTLTGHHSRINDVHAIDRQRVLSASNDGSIILWDINKQQSINKVAKLDNISINAITLTSESSIACACSDGLIRFYDLNRDTPNEIIHQMKVGAPVSALCHLSGSQQLIYGTEQSTVGIYDIREPTDTVVYAWKEQRGRINCVIPNRNQTGIIAATSDGSLFEYNQEELKTMLDGSQYHVTDYTGADDAVFNCKVFQDKIFSICRDGLVRVYQGHA